MSMYWVIVLANQVLHNWFVKEFKRKAEASSMQTAYEEHINAWLDCHVGRESKCFLQIRSQIPRICSFREESLPVKQL